MFTKTKIALAAALVAATSSMAFAAYKTAPVQLVQTAVPWKSSRTPPVMRTRSKSTALTERPRLTRAATN